MTTPTTYEQFVAQVTESNLLSAEDITVVVNAVPKDRRPKDGEQLARELVRHNKLTVYQAQQVYAGKGKELVRGNYVILDKLGKGGMGVVYKAEHKRMRRQVALKVLSPQATKSPEAVKRFHREVEAAAKLNHPNIVAAYDADEFNGTHFLVMEYVEGDDLSNTVKKNGPLSVDKAVSYMLQAARGLEFAHQRGVIHRDIKPANMLLDGEGNVKILDMGLARFESDVAGEAELTSTGQVMGTVDYMAPEQALSTKQADQRSDIYSLGMSLWFLLTGHSAYGGDSLMARMLAHREQPIPSLCATRKDAPKQLDAIFAKMIAKNAKDRYQSMSEVAAALETCRPGSAERTEPQVQKDDDRLLGAVMREQARPSQMKLPVAQPLTPEKPAKSIVGPKPPAAHAAPPIAKPAAPDARPAPRTAVAPAAPPPARSKTNVHSVEETMNTGAPSGNTDSQLNRLFNVASPAPLPVGAAKKKGAPWWQDQRVLLLGGIGAAVVAGMLLLVIAGIAIFFGSGGEEIAEQTATNTAVDGVQGSTGTSTIDGAQPLVIPLVASGSIVVLDELLASPFHMSPWPSTDGLRLYYEGFTGKGTSGHGVLMASRSSVGAEFGEPVFVFNGRHPCLTADELEMVCIGHDTPAPLLMTRRVSRDGTFAPPTIMFERALDKVLDSNVKSPFISGDGKMLAWQRDPDSGRGIEFAVLHRVSRDATWAVPPNSVKVFNEKARGKPPTWPWVSADNMFTIWSHGGDRTAEIWTARRRSKGEDYSDFRPLLVDGKPLVGRSPRLCEATGELFFSQPTGSDNWQLAVLKDFWPQGKPASAVSPPTAPPQGFASLFNGRDLSGWEVMQTTGSGADNQTEHRLGSGGWEVSGGILKCTTAVPGWLKTRNQYENFELQLEYRLPLSMSNSGIYIRSPDTGHLSRVGMEVQIVSNAKAQAGENAGSIHRASASSRADRPVGEWNTMRIVCLGSAIEVTLNGSLVMQTNMGTNAMLRDRPRKGFIGLANWMGQAQGVEFRNLWIKELASSPQVIEGANWQPLFPGYDLSAWKGKSGMWSLTSGDLTGTPSTPPSYSFLFSPKPYADFELQFQARLRNDQDNSGVQIRSEVFDTTGWSARGPQVEVGGAGTWGGLYGEQLQIQGGWLVPSTGSPTIKRDDFNDYFIRCAGKHVTVKVNGITTVDADVPSMDDKGLIAFQVHRRNTADVTFRNIQIRELDETAPSAEPEIIGTAKFNGHDYKFFPEVLSWKEARAKCVAEGGDLVVIDSLAENTFVAGLVSAGGALDCWVGATDEASEATWLSPSGKLLTFLNWSKGQPNNKNQNEHFAVMSNRTFGGRTFNWEWSDQPDVALAQQHQPGYVCEWQSQTSVSASPAVGDTGEAVGKEAGWVELLNGRDCTGWTMLDGKPATWKAEGGYIEVTTGHLRTVKEFGPDFELQAEFWIPGQPTRSGQGRGNSGIFLIGRHEVQIVDAYGNNVGGPDKTCGSVYGVAGVTADAIQPPETWQTFHIKYQAPRWDGNKLQTPGRVTVTHNGKEVVANAPISATSLAGPITTPGSRGPIVLQDHGSPVRFRNLRIRESAAAADVGWIDLFNGRDLTGWQEFVTRGQWSAKNGSIFTTGGTGGGWLATEKQFGNFELELEYRQLANSNSGVFLRIPDDGLANGGDFLEVQIVSSSGLSALQRTGALYRVIPAEVSPDTPAATWHRLKVRAVGSQITTWVNDEQVALGDVDTAVVSGTPMAHIRRRIGRIGFQRHTTPVEFRKIRIREL